MGLMVIVIVLLACIVVVGSMIRLIQVFRPPGRLDFDAHELREERKLRDEVDALREEVEQLREEVRQLSIGPKASSSVHIKEG